MKIHRYFLAEDWFQETEITVPSGSKVVGFERHNSGRLALWLLLGTDAPVTRWFTVVPTGEDFAGEYVAFYSEVSTVYHLVETTQVSSPTQSTSTSSVSSNVTNVVVNNTTSTPQLPISEYRKNELVFYYKGDNDDKPYLRKATPITIGVNKEGRQYMKALSYSTDQKSGGIRDFFFDQMEVVKFYV